MSACVVALSTALAHCVLLVSDGVFWDDWIYVKAISEHRMGIVDQKFNESGVFHAPYFFRALSHLPGPVYGSKLVVFAMLVGIALLAYWLARSSRRLTNPESAFVAIVVGTFPAFQTTPVLVTSIYTLSLFGWFSGMALLRAGQVHPRARIPLRVAGLALLFFLAFPTNSFLPFTYVGLGLLFLMESQPGATRLRDAPRFALRNLDVLVLPIAFWLYKERAYPRGGEYAEYNRIQPSVGALVRHSLEFLNTSIFAQVNLALKQVPERPALVLLVLALFLFLWFRSERKAALSAESAWKSTHLALLGLVVLGAAIFPYAVVDKGPHLHGKATRHALLLALPVGLLALAALRRFARGADDSVRPAGLVLGATVLLGFVLCDIDNEVAWQARWVKDRAIVHTLAKMPDAKRYSVFWVEDPSIPAEWDHYSYHDWSNLFRLAWGGQSHIGLDLMNSPASQLTDPTTRSDHYSLADLDPNGPQATLTIKMKTLPEGNSDYDLVTHYVGYKLTRSPRLEEYLGRLLEIEIAPASGPPGGAEAPAAPRTKASPAPPAE